MNNTPETKTDYQEVLGKLNVVDVAVKTFNGYVKRSDVETDELRTAGSLRIMDPKHTNLFPSTRVAVRRACLSVGVGFLGAFAVPDEEVEPLAKKISILGKKFMEGKDYLVANYDNLLMEWADKHPEFKNDILDRAPKKEYVQNQIEFGMRIFKVIPQSERVIQCGAEDGIKSDLQGLAGQLVKEVAQEVRDNWSNTGNANARSMGFLKRILSKVKSLSFIDPRVNEIAFFIEETISKFPASGKVEGHDYLVFSGLMGILGNEKRLMNEVLSVSVESNPAEVVAEAAAPIEVVSNTVSELPQDFTQVDLTPEQIQNKVDELVSKALSTAKKVEIESVVSPAEQAVLDANTDLFEDKQLDVSVVFEPKADGHLSDEDVLHEAPKLPEEDKTSLPAYAW